MTSGPPPTEILPVSQVAELINGLVKALRAYHMYLPNNPIYQRASDNLRIAFQPIWAVLDVTGIFYGDRARLFRRGPNKIDMNLRPGSRLPAG